MTSCRTVTAVVLLLALLPAAAAQGPTVASLPVDPAAFGDLLNWLKKAPAEGQDQFLEKVAAVQNQDDPTAKAQVALLKIVAREGRDEPKKLATDYLTLADDPQTPSAYATTAAFRAAVLAAEHIDPATANASLVVTRRVFTGGQLWSLRDDSWKTADVDTAIEELFLRVNETLLQYRGALWLAEVVATEGVEGFLFNLLVLYAVIRLLEVPMFVRILHERDDPAAQQAARGWHVMAFLFVDLVMLWWINAYWPIWVFVFELHRAPFLWLTALTARDAGALTAAYVCMIAYAAALSWEEYRHAFAVYTRWYVVFAAVSGIILYRTPHNCAAQNLMLLVQCASGFVTVLCCRWLVGVADKLRP